MSLPMRHWKLITMFAAISLMSQGCIPEPIIHYDPFSIRVVDNAGTPLDSVSVYAFGSREIDWGIRSYERYQTNQYGRVELDGYGNGKRGSIRLANYLPVDTTMIPDAVYTLTPAPYVATTIAALEGDNYRFTKDGIVSMTSRGYYRYYPMTGSGVSAPASMQLQTSASTYSSWLTGDELWLRNSTKSLFRYDLTDPMNPSFIGEYRFLPFSDRYDLRLTFGDGFILVGGLHRDVIAVVEIVGDSLLERSTFPSSGYDRIMLRGRRLLMLDENGISGYDISDLRNPVLVTSDISGENGGAIFGDSLMMLRVDGWSDRDSSEYQIYDVRDPTSPVATERVMVPGWMHYIADARHGYAEFDRRFSVVNEAETIYVIRPAGSLTFGIAGYSPNYTSAARGNLAIVSDVLYRWDAR